MERAANNRVRVEIHGIEYTLRGPESDRYLRSVARQVNDLMGQIADANPQLDDKRLAVLAAVNLADELSKLRAQHQELLDRLEDRADVSTDNGTASAVSRGE